MFGFVVEFELRSELDETAANALRVAFEREVIEARGLVCRGGHHAARWCPVVRGEAGQATAGDREAVLAWAHGRPEIVAARAGELVDLGDG